ncbi:hypothetical protein HD806DRAFT_287970 [Xylariaceae sp. AK1471]|nr:hypothetical protein HD806DRAFT_287970 [Xylariaceae sp. AK1471]
MHDMRYSVVSIDSLIDQNSDSHHTVDSRRYATLIDNNGADSTTDTTTLCPQHQQPWKASTTPYMSVLEGNHSLALGSKVEGSVDTLRNVSRSQSSFARRMRRVWYYGWVAESLGCGLAVISLVAIVITLRLHENRPLPDWPYGININALIAIFGVLLKAGVTVPLSEGISQLKWQWFEQKRRSLIDLDGFDAASRGAWGSFLFLFTLHGEPFTRPSHRWFFPRSFVRFLFNWKAIHLAGYFAKFAAFLTVLVMAVDPFTQQIIQYVSCPQVSVSDQSFIARTNSYYAQGGHTGAGENDIDSPMAVAINTGLTNPPEHIQSLVSTDCKSGNCTFENFASVGLCRSCEDLTSQIQNITADGGWNFTLPGDAEDEYGFPSLYLYHQYSFRSSATFSSLSRLLDLRVISGPNHLAMTGELSAFHCSIVSCVRTYSSSILENNLNESVLSSIPLGFNLNIVDDDKVDDEVQGRGRALLRLATSRTLRNGQEENCLPSDKEGPGLVKVAKANVDAAPDDSFATGVANATAWYPEDCVWSFGQGSAYAIRQTLGSELDGLDMQSTSGVTVGPIVAKNMWRNGTVDLAHMNDYMQKLADVMTATMRNRGWGGRDEYARGQVIVNDTCLQVRWAWLAYPAALVGLTVWFLVLIIIQGPQGASARVWKSSILAPLFISMDDKIYDVNHYDMSKSDMSQLAEEIQTQLVRDPVGKAKFL